jgi:hypothetical protein
MSIKHRNLRAYPLHADLSQLDADVYELTISEQQTRHPLRQVALFACSRREAIRQFTDFLTKHYPKS